jgi:hypothetical protein
MVPDTLENLTLIVPVVSAPKAQKAQANYFIRSMAPTFQIIFQRLRPNLLALLTSVVFNDVDITESTVRSCMKQYKKTLKKTHREEVVDALIFQWK